MKKSIPFELFGPNQYIMFDILRLAELEKAIGSSIMKIAVEQDISINFCIAALSIGMKQHYQPNPTLYAQKIEEYLDKGGTLMDIVTPLIQAIAATGIFGNTAKTATEETDDRKNLKEGTE